MTKRMLHENITTSEKFSKVGFEAECLYNRLLTQTDDYGNVRGSIGYIKDVCFPKNKTNKKIDYQMVGKWLAECLQVGLLIAYSVDGIKYLHFNRFDDFQKLRQDRLKISSIPSYSKLRSNGWQVDNQMVADCPHELEVKEEVEVEDKYSYEFLQVWEKYPSNRREKKSDCYKYWKQIPKDKKETFEQATSSYVTNNSKENYKYCKMSSRWFKDWETSLDYKQEPKKELTMYEREQRIREERSRYLDEHSKGASND